jgi:hypothetical protein
MDAHVPEPRTVGTVPTGGVNSPLPLFVPVLSEWLLPRISPMTCDSRKALQGGLDRTVTSSNIS